MKNAVLKDSFEMHLKIKAWQFILREDFRLSLPSPTMKWVKTWTFSWDFAPQKPASYVHVPH